MILVPRVEKNRERSYLDIARNFKSLFLRSENVGIRGNEEESRFFVPLSGVSRKNYSDDMLARS